MRFRRSWRTANDARPLDTRPCLLSWRTRLLRPGSPSNVGFGISASAVHLRTVRTSIALSHYYTGSWRQPTAAAPPASPKPSGNARLGTRFVVVASGGGDGLADPKRPEFPRTEALQQDAHESSVRTQLRVSGDWKASGR